MDTTRDPGHGTSVARTGNVDRNGDIVDELVAATRGPLELGYVERPGLDDRIRAAGGDVAGVRRLLRCS